MPRRSGARTSAKAPQRSAPPATRPAPPPPAPAAAAPPPAMPQQGGGMMSGLMGSMASGMAMGTGMAVANRAVDAVMGPRQTEVVHTHQGGEAPAAAPAAVDKCMNEREWIKQCMGQANGDPTQCNYYADLLKQCQTSQGAAVGA